MGSFPVGFVRVRGSGQADLRSSSESAPLDSLASRSNPGGQRQLLWARCRVSVARADSRRLLPFSSYVSTVEYLIRVSSAVQPSAASGASSVRADRPGECASRSPRRPTAPRRSGTPAGLLYGYFPSEPGPSRLIYWSHRPWCHRDRRCWLGPLLWSNFARSSALRSKNWTNGSILSGFTITVSDCKRSTSRRTP